MTGTSFGGIYARNFGTSLTVDAAAVLGGPYGIDARNYGPEAVGVMGSGAWGWCAGAGI